MGLKYTYRDDFAYVFRRIWDVDWLIYFERKINYCFKPTVRLKMNILPIIRHHSIQIMSFLMGYLCLNTRGPTNHHQLLKLSAISYYRSCDAHCNVYFKI